MCTGSKEGFNFSFNLHILPSWVGTFSVSYEFSSLLRSTIFTRLPVEGSSSLRFWREGLKSLFLFIFWFWFCFMVNVYFPFIYLYIYIFKMCNECIVWYIWYISPSKPRSEKNLYNLTLSSSERRVWKESLTSRASSRTKNSLFPQAWAQQLRDMDTPTRASIPS